LTRLVALLLLAAAPAWGAPFVLQQTVLDPFPAVGNLFGGALAAAGGTVVVGAPFNDVGGADSGAAYLVDPYSGARLLTFTSPHPGGGYHFGAAVAAVGDTVVVGAPRARVVYVFDAQSGAVVQTIPSPRPFDDLFGSSLAAVGNAVLVGAPFDGTGQPGAGAAHLFDPRSGTLLRTFVNPNPGPYDLFGQAVAAAGANVLVGAPYDDTTAPNAGAAYLFDTSSGALLHTFTSPRIHRGDLFGSAVAGVDGNVLVGAPFDASVASNAGAAYLFDASTGALLRAFVDPDPITDERFGSSVAGVAGNVLVGAPLADGDEVNAGIVHLFDPATGQPLATFVNPTPTANDQFGITLAAIGADIVVGGWLDDTAAVDSGAVYLYVDTAAPSSTSTTRTTTTSTTTLTVTTTSSTSTVTTTSTTGATAPPTTQTTTTQTTTTETSITAAPATTTTGTSPPPTTVATSSSSSTSTTAAAPSTTTTLPASPGLPSPCDDGDACTFDLLTPSGVCRHTALVSFDAVLCRLDKLSVMLKSFSPAALGGSRIVGRLQPKIAAARRLVEGARSDYGKRATRRLKRASHALAAFIATVDRNERRGRVQQVLADGMTSVARDAAGQLLLIP